MKRHGQSTLEFTFAMMASLLLLWGMIRVFAWSGRDLLQRSGAHENALMRDVPLTADGPRHQIEPLFFNAAPLDATIDSEIFVND